MATMTETEPQFVKLELRTAYGPVFRDVSTRPAREARSDEIPVVDLSGIYGTFEERKQLAKTIKRAAENTGFFYIKNHGISEEVIHGALDAAKSFFKQSEEKKQLVAQNKGNFFNGYSARNTAAASPTEGRK